MLVVHYLVFVGKIFWVSLSLTLLSLCCLCALGAHYVACAVCFPLGSVLVGLEVNRLLQLAGVLSTNAFETLQVPQVVVVGFFSSSPLMVDLVHFCLLGTSVGPRG